MQTEHGQQIQIGASPQVCTPSHSADARTGKGKIPWRMAQWRKANILTPDCDRCLEAVQQLCLCRAAVLHCYATKNHTASRLHGLSTQRRLAVNNMAQLLAVARTKQAWQPTATHGSCLLNAFLVHMSMFFDALQPWQQVVGEQCTHARRHGR